jgi:tetratricopeptide (TPR) repeat protein
MKIISGFFLFFIPAAFCGTSIEAGWDCYYRCMRGEVDFKTSPQVIDSAIAVFEAALKSPDTEKAAAEGFMRAAMLKGWHVLKDNKSKKDLYRRGKTIGEKFSKKYPQSSEIKYWYAVCLGCWAEVFGKIAAAREGIADKLKDLCEDVIKLGSKNMSADGYRVLGRVHHLSPRIPFILSWPSNKDALKNLEKSNKLMPNVPATLLFLAEVLEDENQKDRAFEIIKQAVSLSPRPDHKIDDVRRLKQCRKMLARLEKK